MVGSENYYQPTGGCYCLGGFNKTCGIPHPTGAVGMDSRGRNRGTLTPIFSNLLSKKQEKHDIVIF